MCVLAVDLCWVGVGTFNEADPVPRCACATRANDVLYLTGRARDKVGARSPTQWTEGELSTATKAKPSQATVARIVLE